MYNNNNKYLNYKYKINAIIIIGTFNENNRLAVDCFDQSSFWL